MCDAPRARWREISFFMLWRPRLISLMQMTAASKKGKENAIGRLKELYGKCVTGAETSTVLQCVPLRGTREWAVEGVQGGAFLFIRALVFKGLPLIFLPP